MEDKRKMEASNLMDIYNFVNENKRINFFDLEPDLRKKNFVKNFGNIEKKYLLNSQRFQKLELIATFDFQQFEELMLQKTENKTLFFSIWGELIASITSDRKKTIRELNILEKEKLFDYFFIEKV